MVEAALGEMHRAYEPDLFVNGPPIYYHSVYGVGELKPSISGLKDLNSPEFKVDQSTVCTPQPLFFQTGVLK